MTIPWAIIIAAVILGFFAFMCFIYYIDNVYEHNKDEG